MVRAQQIDADLVDLVGDGIVAGAGPRGFLFRGIAVGDHALAALVWDRVSRKD
jgi:hypothetical protein